MSLNLPLFWAIVVLMTVIACLFVVVPFFRFNTVQTGKGIKSQWYRSRLGELEAEFKRGQFNQEQFDSAVNELKLTAMDELKVEQQADSSKTIDATDTTEENTPLAKSYMVSALGILIVTVAISYWYFGEQDKLKQWQTTLEKMPSLTQQVLEGTDIRPSEQDLKDFSLGLRTKLQNEPNAIGWMLLGRNLSLLGDLDGAIKAFEKSYNLDPKSISNMISFASVLQQNGEPGDYKRSIRILKNALSLNPQNLTALIMLAEGEMLNEQFESSLKGFILVKKVMESNDPRFEAVQQRIEFLSSKSAVVTVTLEVAENIDLSEFKALFVFAKEPNTPMPLAVKKLNNPANLFTVTKLNKRQLVVTLSNEDVMIKTMSLSDKEHVELFARLSKDEQAPFEVGDLDVESKAIKLQTERSVSLSFKSETELEK